MMAARADVMTDQRPTHLQDDHWVCCTHHTLQRYVLCSRAKLYAGIWHQSWMWVGESLTMKASVSLNKSHAVSLNKSHA